MWLPRPILELLPRSCQITLCYPPKIANYHFFLLFIELKINPNFPVILLITLVFAYSLFPPLLLRICGIFIGIPTTIHPEFYVVCNSTNSLVSLRRTISVGSIVSFWNRIIAIVNLKISNDRASACPNGLCFGQEGFSRFSCHLGVYVEQFCWRGVVQPKSEKFRKTENRS